MIRRFGVFALLVFAVVPTAAEARGPRGGMVVSPFGPMYDNSSPEFRAAGGDLEVYQQLMQQKLMMQQYQQMMKMQKQYQQMMKNQKNNPQMNSANTNTNNMLPARPPVMTSRKKKKTTRTTSTSSATSSKTAKPAAKEAEDTAKAGTKAEKKN